uniref:hypothetical protein n=1 Tax=Succinivibrio sp. TaxID=2053619 RepID=UPI00402AB974
MDVSKAIGFTDKQLNLVVYRLNSSIAEFSLNGIEDMLLMPPDFIGMLFENLNSAVSSFPKERLKFSFSFFYICYEVTFVKYLFSDLDKT